MKSAITQDPDAPLPVDDRARRICSKTAPLHTPEWAAWRARMRAPKLAGRWIVSAYIPGRGKFYGDMEVEASNGTDDEFTTRVKLTSVKDGTTISRTGHSLVYAGYAWRGRSKGTPAANAAPDDLGSEMREVMWISPDQSTAEGRWFWGEYQEFGFDVKLQRASADPTLIGADRSLAEDRHRRQSRVGLIAESLPAQIAPADLDFGTGVTVKRIVSHTPTEIVAEVDVAADAVSGQARYCVPPLGAAKRDRGLRSHRLHQSDAGLGAGAAGQRKASQGLSTVRGGRLSARRGRQACTPPTMSSSDPST